MDSSPFAKLSPELRNHIYELVLRSPGQSTLELRDIKKLHALTQTCQQIRRESQPMLYGLNNFAFTTSNRRLGKFCGFLEALGPDVVAGLRSLRMRSLRSNIEIRGVETTEAATSSSSSSEKSYAISPRGVEVVIFETLTRMGLQARGKGSTWYTTATWYVGYWTKEETSSTANQWLRVT